jgi:hypothetical protein
MRLIPFASEVADQMQSEQALDVTQRNWCKAAACCGEAIFDSPASPLATGSSAQLAIAVW